MLQAYFDRRRFAPAVFELFVRKLPATRDALERAGVTIGNSAAPTVSTSTY